MADVKWIKLTTNIFDDEKILMIESLPSADTIIVIWFKLLTLAGKCNNNGVFMMNNRIPYTDEMLAAIFRRDDKIVKIALNTFEQFGMIEIIDDVITIPNWAKHQSLDAYEKKKERDRKLQAERRAKQRALIGKSSDNRLTSSDSSPDVAVSEEDEDKDKEKEIHSFILSRESEEKSPEEKAAEQRRYLKGIGEGVVFLSDDQIGALLDEISVEEFDHYVKVIAECEKSGKRFKKKTHFEAILEMARKDRKV